MPPLSDFSCQQPFGAPRTQAGTAGYSYHEEPAFNCRLRALRVYKPHSQPVHALSLYMAAPSDSTSTPTAGLLLVTQGSTSAVPQPSLELEVSPLGFSLFQAGSQPYLTDCCMPSPVFSSFFLWQWSFSHTWSLIILNQ